MERIKNGFDVDFFYKGKVLNKRVYVKNIQIDTKANKGILPENKWICSFQLLCDNEFVCFCFLGEKVENVFKLKHLEFRAYKYGITTNIDFYKLTTF